jgi:hypothetical protein
MFFLVDSLDYNLLSVSHLCKMGYNCLLTDIGVNVFRRSDDSIVKRPDPLGLKCETITSPKRLVNTFLTSNSTEFR